MDPSEDDFLTARWTGRGTGPRRSGLTWRGRLVIGVLAFVAMVPVAVALRDDTEVSPRPAGSGATAVVWPVAPHASPTTTIAVVTSTSLGTTTTTIAPTTTTTEPPCPQRFEVREGDSWYGLAAASEVTVRELLTANGAQLSTMLFPGRSICLPAGARRPPATTTTAPTTSRAPATTTTKAPAPAPTTTVPVPPRASTDDVLRLIREIWPPELHDEAILIAQRESRLQSNVRNSCCWGLFQIHFTAHRAWLASQGVTQPVQLLDAATNVRMARALYVRSNGWGPWGW